MKKNKEKPLILNLKKEYFDQVKTGIKKEEFRIIKEFWKKRLFNKDGTKKVFSEVIIKLGYPKSNELDKIINFPWNSFYEKELTHKEFGDDPVLVYAIILEKN